MIYYPCSFFVFLDGGGGDPRTTDRGLPPPLSQQSKPNPGQQAETPREALHRRAERFKHGAEDGDAAPRTRSSRRSRGVCGGRGSEGRRPPRRPEEHQRPGRSPQLGGRFGDGSLCRSCAAKNLKFNGSCEGFVPFPPQLNTDVKAEHQRQDGDVGGRAKVARPVSVSFFFLLIFFSVPFRDNVPEKD